MHGDLNVLIGLEEIHVDSASSNQNVKTVTTHMLQQRSQY